MQYNINDRSSEHNWSVLSSWCFFLAKEKSCTYCFPDSSPPSSSASPGRLCNTVPSSSFLRTTKHCFILFYFSSPPSQRSYYSALFCIWPGGDGRRNTLAVDDNVFPHSWNLWASHFSGCGFAAIWFCCSTAEWRRVVLSLWPIGDSCICYYYTIL